MQPYSSEDRTSDILASSFNFGGKALKFLIKKPRVLIPFFYNLVDISTPLDVISTE